jgi:hypothetical protein
MLSYGPLTGTCNQVDGEGITITPHGTEVSGALGSFQYAQLLHGGFATYSVSGTAPSCLSLISDGDDGGFPITGEGDDQSFIDYPAIPLWPQYHTASETFIATTYLMWQDVEHMDQDDSPIPVPLGYVTWSFNPFATKGTSNLWIASGDAGPVMSNDGSVFTLSKPTQPNYGFPTWNGPAAPLTSCRPQ